MKTAIDVSPSLINRTAIYRIIEDTLVGYPDSPVKILGIPIPRRFVQSRYFRAMGRRLIAGLLTSPNALLLLLPALRILLRVLTPSRPTLYFDPLYSIFEPRINKSTVIVLDLTSVTCPQFHNSRVMTLYNAALHRIAHSRCKIVSISESTKTDLWANLGIAPDTVT
ncbi:MAG: hypothetical protein KDD68_15225, partial [Bdellovibrionales bacterium]|nr:hypothetical protein [Bdellovibrionales bacterium]